VQIFIRLKAGQEEKLSKTLNYTYIPEKSIKVKVLPVPEFIKDAVCKSCRQPAKFMLEDMTLICQPCLEQILKSVSTLEKKEDTLVPLTEETLAKIKFEWSTDRERWYSIRGIGLKPKNTKSFLETIKKVFISGQFLVCEAEYNKDAKELIIQ
jgi:hypothetical protein